MKLFRTLLSWKFYGAIIGLPVLIVGLFLISAWVGSGIAANDDWQQPHDGVPIFVESNGIHVSLIVPMVAQGEDLSDLIRPDQLQDTALYGTHAMIGWGHAGVYRNARTWADVRSGDIASAIIGSDNTVLHIYHLNNPVPNTHTRALRVTPAQYHRIITQIRARFRLDLNGHSIAYPAYGPDNVFYAANGHYDVLHTCNEWTGSILRNAGVRVGLWTPLAGGVMRWFPEHDPKTTMIK